MKWIAASLLMLALAACGKANDDFTGQNLMQRTVRANTAATLTLQAGDSLTVPAGTFDRPAVVLFADVFTGLDGSTTYFPTTTKAKEDLIAAVVINTPVDRTFHTNLPLTFDIIQPGETRLTSAVTAGQQYIVYKFDFDTNTWEPWGSTVATISSDGQSATTTLPTVDLTGFIGSLALFAGKTAG